MKKIYFLLVFFGALLFCACEKEITTPPDLQQEDISALKGAQSGQHADHTYGYEKLKEHWVNVDGVNVNYTKNGRGKEVIVFIHGLSGNKYEWLKYNEYLCSKARIIMIDLPGHGESDAPDIDYTMDFLAKAVYAVMMEAGAGDAILVTHSMGLAVARQLIFHNPGLVKKLINLEGGVFQYPGDEGFAGFILGLFASPYPPDFVYQGFISSVFSAFTPEEAQAEILENIVEFPKNVFYSLWYELLREDIWVIQPWDTPMLSVYATWGNYDKVVALHGEYPFVVLEGAGHLIHLDFPNEINELIDEFVFD